MENSNMPSEVKAVLLSQSAQFFSGPIPSPKHMAEYENILPGAADRILSMAEKEQEFRCDITNRTLSKDEREGVFGFVAATLISVCALAAGVVVAICSTTTVGAVVAGIFGISGIGSIAIAMINKTKEQK